uniref:G-protein coupled receptors family 1 profile domain-containing protein n=1 Tax=Panagrolaimus superbus TaxID=310955 RepID=A0A914Y1P1_9BILA
MKQSVPWQLFLIFLTFVQICAAFSNAPTSFLFEKSCRGVEYNSCKCIIRTKETKCCCLGRIEKVTESINVLFLYKPDFIYIDRFTFKNYTKLQEIIIDSATELSAIDGRAFDNLPDLRKISITAAPKLIEINGTLLLKNHKLQSLIISNTSLKRLPNLKMSISHMLTMDIIDFSQNQISYVGNGQVSGIHARTLKLSGNEISYIHEKAFAQSKFVSLYLNDNHELATMSLLAFADISELHQLDLSETSISELPVIGLKDIKHLILKNVPTLKKLPPVLAFNNLNKAEFTYPYHCCFFKHASRDYAVGQGSQYSSHYKEIQQRSCTREALKSPEVQKLLRKKRETSATTDPLIDSLSAWFDLMDSQNTQIDINSTEDEEEDEFDVFDGLKAYPADEVGNSRILQRCLKVAVDRFYLNISCSPVPDALNPCEDIVGYWWLRYIIWGIWIMAIFGNVLVWIVIVTIWHRRSRLHYFFMVNLSIADFLTGIYLGILAMKDAFTANEYYNYAVEWQTGWGCAVAGFLSVFASELSIVSLLWIAFEIYYNARFAFYGKRLTSRNAVPLMGIAYLYALIMASLPFFGVSSYQRTSICLPLSIQSNVDRIYIVFGLSISALCFVGMVVNYILINFMIRNPGGPAKKQDAQIFRRSLALIVTNMVCWVPVLFFGITASLGYPLITITNAKICLVLFYPINSCANPYLYVFLTQMGHEAKKKAVINLKRHSGDKSFSSKFYYAHPPGDREHLRHGEEEANRNMSFLQVTQTTSLNSTPRGSSSSDGTKRSSMDPTDLPDDRKKSFQEQVITHASDSHLKRKSIAPRVSAQPELSEISEHSTNSGEDSEKAVTRTPTFFLEQIKSALFLRRQPSVIHLEMLEIPEEAPMELPQKRENSVISLGQDSGKGESIPRNSISSNETQEDKHRKFSVHSSVIQKSHLHRKRSDHKPETPALVLSEYLSFDES